jgi:hypothetical protein
MVHVRPRSASTRSRRVRATLSLHALASGAKKRRAREDIAEGRDTPDLLEAPAVVAN